MAEESGSDAVVAVLLGLDARSWARLLVVLREGGSGGERVQELLDLPVSELATGMPRRELSAAIAADTSLQELLLAAPDLETVLGDALTASPAATVPAAREDAPQTERDDAPRDVSRERELRRELTQLRRQRDGAEARASLAEARAESSEAAAARADARAEDLAGRLRGADEELAQAVARAERRSASRIAGLEADLAAARAELERVTRRAEQDGTALAALRAQHTELTAQLAALQHLEARDAPDDLDARPLRLPDGVHPETTEAARWLLDAARTLFVDGYNVSLTLRPGQPLETQRRWLIDRLRPLAAQGRVVPVVVFDGDQSAPSGTTSAGVEVRFTPATLTADDDIVFSVTVTGGSVLVVTDDRELRERVRAEGANVIGGRAFLGALDS
jgi:predicted RNA-binding protein with PIN domain